MGDTIYFMKTSQQGFIVPLVLILVALFFIGGGSYAYLQTKQNNQVVNAGSDVQAIPESQAGEGQILLGDRAMYENLSAEEKRMVDKYYETTSKWHDEESRKMFPPSTCVLKYYDPEQILIACDKGKDALQFFLVDKNTSELKKDSGFLFFYGEYLESKNYLISVGESIIYYYRVGDTNIKLVPGSKLIDADAGETYNKGSVARYPLGFTAAFVEPTKMLTVSVYKADRGVDNPPDGKFYQKIRTMQFALP